MSTANSEFVVLDFDPVSFMVLGHPEPAGSKTNMPRRRFPVTLYSMRDFLAAFPLTDANVKTKAWKNRVAQAAKGKMLKTRREPISGPVFVEFVFFRSRPRSHMKSNGGLRLEGMRHPWPDTKPDVLKLARAAEDALSGIVYKDDALIVDERIRKRWGPIEGVQVTVMPL